MTTPCAQLIRSFAFALLLLALGQGSAVAEEAYTPGISVGYGRNRLYVFEGASVGTLVHEGPHFHLSWEQPRPSTGQGWKKDQILITPFYANKQRVTHEEVEQDMDGKHIIDIIPEEKPVGTSVMGVRAVWNYGVGYGAQLGTSGVFGFISGGLGALFAKGEAYLHRIESYDQCYTSDSEDQLEKHCKKVKILTLLPLLGIGGALGYRGAKFDAGFSLLVFSGGDGTYSYITDLYLWGVTYYL